MMIDGASSALGTAAGDALPSLKKSSKKLLAVCEAICVLPGIYTSD